MKGWILSLVAVILTTSCAEMLLPDGKLKNACRTVLALACIGAFIMPIGKLENIDIDFSEYAIETSNEDYVKSTADYYCRLYAAEAKKVMESEGAVVSGCSAEGSFERGKFILSGLFVKVENSVISGEDEHIIGIEEITLKLSERLGISPDKVVIYGW